jgi:hypothetical protein
MHTLCIYQYYVTQTLVTYQKFHVMGCKLCNFCCNLFLCGTREGYKNMLNNLHVHLFYVSVSSSVHIQGLRPHGPFQPQQNNPEVPVVDVLGSYFLVVDVS